MTRHKTPKPDTERYTILDEIVRDSFHCFLRDPPSDTLEIIEAWHAVLSEVPSERLYDVYLRAMREHRGNELISAPELVRAWYDIGNVLDRTRS